jgi:hypothetical protein
LRLSEGLTYVLKHTLSGQRAMGYLRSFVYLERELDSAAKYERWMLPLRIL